MKSVLNVFFIKKTGWVCILIVLLSAIELSAKPKQLPLLLNYKSMYLKKNNVDKLTVKVYEPNEKDLVDFPVVFYFDDQGTRIKKTTLHIETLKTEAIDTWEYNRDAGTVIMIRLDTLSEQVWKRNFSQQNKPLVINMKYYEPWFDESKNEKHFEMLSYEDRWTEIPKRKIIEQIRTSYALDRGIISKKSTREFTLSKTQNIYDLIDAANATNDYTWLPLYDEDTQKAMHRATRSEMLFDSTKYTYKLKKKLLSEKSKLHKDGSLDVKTTYSYEFDEEGNWVKLTQSDNGKIRFVVIREISYRPKNK